ncbi:MAG TPA: hypothetical protein VFJ71_12540 [Candidatus Limnocylindrales bacterium]|nr:hypothetical protein [Candidatus Limnocylindrales bacterium]
MTANAWVGRIPASADSTRAEHPGRWLGGMVGSLACLPPLTVGLVLNGGAFSRPMGFSALGGAIATFSALGIPIGWLLGRQLWPSLRSNGWQHAVAIGLAFGWTAPVLGAGEICFGGLLAPWANPPLLMGTDGWWIFPVAVPVSFLAAPLTLSVGLCWAIAGRLIPSTWASRARVPRPFDRLGSRHVLIAVLSWTVVAEIATIIARGSALRR